MDRRSIGINNKRKGCNAERYYAKIFRELGFTFCKTSRLGSKLHDNAKIDLIFVPFNIQIKAGKQKNMHPGKELVYLKSSIQLVFPPMNEVHTNSCLLIHYEEVGPGRKRMYENEKLYMSLNQFNIYKKDIKSLKYDSIKNYKFENKSEFEELVCITFEYFKNEIIKKLYGINNNTTSQN